MFLALSFMQVQAQDVSNDSVNTFNEERQIDISIDVYEMDLSDEIEESTIYQVVEEQPEFPGGMGALMKYLRKNRSKNNKSHGRTFVNFVVNTDGSLTNIEVEKSSGYELLDKEALQIVRKMPKWKPGKQAGKPVRVRFTLPIIL